jgi:hypothetical protein
VSSRKNGLSSPALALKALQDRADLLSYLGVFVDLILKVFKNAWIYHAGNI